MSPPMLKPGDLVGPYEIKGFVGQGGMGQVYRAFDPRLERTVALKIIQVASPTAATTRPERRGPLTPSAGLGAAGDRDSGRLLGEVSSRMLREARAVASLTHPNVVAIYDVGESSGLLYFAMEFVVGAPLRTFVGDGTVALGRRVRWLIDIARALEAAHRAGIVHRDVKPENVMIRDDGAVKVLDFGIARRTMGRGDDQQAAIDTVTGSGSIAGTPVYMAPEQIKGASVDARTDQFAWGVLAYELMTGQRPWEEGGDLLSLVARILTDPVRPLPSGQLPAVVEETILRALAKAPQDRFPTMSDAADALEPFATTTTGGGGVKITPAPKAVDESVFATTTRVPTTVTPPNAEVTTERTRPASRRGPLALALPLVLLGGLGAAVYVVKTRPPGPPPPRPVTVTTGTPSAPRPLSTVPQAEAAFKEAMNLWHDGAGAKAAAALRQAVELDPTFAAAHLELALQQASNDDTAGAQASFQSAYEHRQMLTTRDSLLLEASETFARTKQDYEEWETRMTSVVFQFPRDPELQLYLGRARERQGDLVGAKSAYIAATRLDEGFVPALAALATTEMALGRTAEGLSTTAACIKRTPIASMCVETRYLLLANAGECKRAREEAATWMSLEPQSPRPLAAFARALHADGAARPSVEEALSRRWTLVPPPERKLEELRDRLALAVLDGDLGRAEELAQAVDAALPVTADAYDHAAPARLRVELLLETDKAKEAAKAAHGYLDRMDAWRPRPLAPDPGIAFLEPLYRAGEIGKAELAERQAAWVQAEKERSRSTLGPWRQWALVHAGLADSRETATAALALAPKQRPSATTPHPDVDYALGVVDALAGRADDAIPALERFLGRCTGFDEPLAFARARLALGQAYETKGELTKARASYQRIVEAWSPRATGSRTLRRANERLATLTRD